MEPSALTAAVLAGEPGAFRGKGLLGPAGAAEAYGAGYGRKLLRVLCFFYGGVLVHRQ